MFEALRSAVDEVEVPADGDALLEAFALLDRLTAKVSVAVAEWDKAKLWELDAATSAAAWLRQRAGMTASVASATVRTANRVAQLPATSAAWLSGELSTGQVRAITANVDDKTVETFAGQEQALLPYLAPLTVSETATAMQHWRARVEVDRLDELPDRSLHLSRTLGGRFELSGSLDALSGEVLATALRIAAVDDPAVSPATRRADAFVDVCRFYLDHQDDKTGGRNRPHLNVVVHYDNLVAGNGGSTVDGTRLDGPTIQALLCDAGVNRVVTSGTSAVLDYGTTTLSRLHPPLERSRAARPALPLRRVRPAVSVLRGPPCRARLARRRDQPRQPGAQMQQAPPHRAPTGLARTAGAGRHADEHRPQGQDPDEPTTRSPRVRSPVDRRPMRPGRVAACAAGAAARATVAVVTTAAERLGYPPDAKLLILNCDDLGSSHAANVGVYQSLREGLATSASLMVPAPWAREAASRYRGEDVGVHLTLNAEYDLYRWGPITHAPSLLDGDGGFPRTLDDIWDHADLDEVRRELRAQVERAIYWGFDVSHLDSHMGALQLRPEFFDIYLDLAVEFALPVRLSGASTEQAIGFPFRRLAEEEGVLFPDNFVYVRGVGSRRALERTLSDLRPGLTELYVHPAVDTAELRALAPDWAARVDDFDLVCNDDTVRTLVERSGVVRIGYRELRDAMRAGRATTA